MWLLYTFLRLSSGPTFYMLSPALMLITQAFQILLTQVWCHPDIYYPESCPPSMLQRGLYLHVTAWSIQTPRIYWWALVRAHIPAWHPPQLWTILWEFHQPLLSTQCCGSYTWCGRSSVQHFYSFFFSTSAIVPTNPGDFLFLSSVSLFQSRKSSLSEIAPPHYTHRLHWVHCGVLLVSRWLLCPPATTSIRRYQIFSVILWFITSHIDSRI